MSLRILFLDLNSYFASVEQQLRPELRGRPVGVVPVMAETSCCIAASYEAKAFGVKTGTAVGEAKKLCPQITLVNARPEAYIKLHHDIIAAVDTCIPIEQVHSIDEFHCRLGRGERERELAIELAMRVKRAIAQRVGDCLRSSIGIAPNRFLAKVGTELEKPDGLVVIESHDLPHKLHALELRDLPGIGPRMHERLIKRGITSVEHLCAASERELVSIWDSVLGRYWHRWLRGEETHEPPTHRRTIGHQHVLPPNLRTDDGARAVLVKLLLKAAARMRQLGYWASQMTLSIRMMRSGNASDRAEWTRHASFPPTQDSLHLCETFRAMWPERLAGTPLRVSITLHDLVSRSSVSQPLFPGEQRRQELARAMDRINTRFGRSAVYPASMHEALNAAPTRIPFQTIPDLDLPV
jgi:DNA polymerase IV